MFKKIVLITVLLIITFIVFLGSYTEIVYEAVSENELNVIKYNYIDIPKIQLRYTYKIQSIKNKNIYGIVMFKEYGRPNEIVSNTIIGGHSGMGLNVFFNQLHKLKIGDIFYINYENEIYKYNVFDIFEVDENDISILNKEYDNNVVTLLTCKINNSKKRLIVLGELVN